MPDWSATKFGARKLIQQNESITDLEIAERMKVSLTFARQVLQCLENKGEIDIEYRIHKKGTT